MAGIRCSQEKLLNFLDEKVTAFSQKEGGWRRKIFYLFFVRGGGGGGGGAGREKDNFKFIFLWKKYGVAGGAHAFGFCISCNLQG